MKNLIQFSFLLIIAFIINGCSNNDGVDFRTETATEDGYTYEYVSGDPTNTRIYTLENGLKVYLSRYTDAPRIQVLMPVKAGGKYDPASNTGLAHYLEHMMFKGTDNFGTMDWGSEKVLLDSIENMFNYYATLTDPDERTAQYAIIDQVSNQAANYAIANEYDKMMALIGAKGTNAYTTEDRTVYMNDIPANELERYLKIESERFQKIVNRLFHTELETVYEEKNRSLDNDYNKAYEKLFESMFENHPYGTQTVIGTIEHLKNPSITEIENYFYKYYIPNNVAICMSGDLDYGQTIKLIDENFSSWESKDLEPVKFDPEPDITSPIVEDIYGPNAEILFMGFRSEGRSSRDFLLLQLVDMVLNNSEAGLIDLNLVQQQLVLGAGSGAYGMNDYSIHLFNGRPKDGQSLEEVRDLILGQVELVKNGEFEDWLIDAVIADFKKYAMRQLESNSARANNMVMAFTNDMKWESFVSELSIMESITKEELVAFANKIYGDNYVVVFKRNGEDPNKQRVEKPQITKVAVNRNEASEFYNTLEQINPPQLQPVYVDYAKDINTMEGPKGVEIRSKVNEENELFSLYYLLDIGSDNDPKMKMAVSYLEYLGTEDLTAEEIKIELYKLGCSFSVSASAGRTYVSLNGLDENMEKAIDIFEKLINNPKADPEALEKLVGRSLKGRSDNMKDKGNILWSGLYNYGKYGPKSSFTNVLSNDELKSLNPEELTDIIIGITKMEHRILYYGPRSIQEVSDVISTHHMLPEKLLPLPEKVEFAELNTDQPKVYWTDYDMVQTEFVMLSKGNTYDPAIVPEIRIFNEYFGGGMNSVVFQEIRESQGLAYSAFASYSTAGKKEKSNYLFSYIGTQADKQPEAMAAMLNLLNNMPESDQAFDIAKKAILNKIESERVTKAAVLWNYESAKDLGLDYDIRKDVYNKVKDMTFDDLKNFHEKYVKNQPFVTVMVGSGDKINQEDLRKYGEVRELSLSELFGYDEVIELNIDM